MDRQHVADWVAGYERAWRAGGTELLLTLFAPNVTYQTGPYEPPSKGLEEILVLWEREREGPGEVFTMDSEIVAVEGDTGVVRVHVQYGDPVQEEYRDLWIIRFDDSGRCAAFEEWPFRAPQVPDQG